MAKITLNGIVSGFKSVAKLISNFDSIEDNLNNKVLYRDNPEGEPNQMESELDMNSNRILNLPTATSATEPLTYGQYTGQTGPVQFEGTVVENQLGSEAVASVFTLTTTTFTPGLQNLAVYINGVRQLNSTYVETSTTQITFNTSPVATDEYTFVVNERAVDATTTDSISVTHTPQGEAASTVQSELYAHQDKLDKLVLDVDRGAVDGADNTTAWQDTIDYCVSNGYKARFITNGILSSDLDISGGIDLVIDSQITLTSGVSEAIKTTSNQRGSTSSLTSNASSYDRTLNVVTSGITGLKAGDVIIVSSSEVFDNRTSSLFGEGSIIESFTASSITLDRPLTFSYTTANTAKVDVYSPHKVNISGSGKIIGDSVTSQWGAVLRNCVDSEVGLEIESCDTGGVRYADSLDSKMLSVRNSDSQNASLGYSTSVYGACRNIQVKNTKSTSSRHAFTTNNPVAPGAGVPIDVFVLDGVSNSTVSTGDAWDTHAAAWNVQFVRCKSLNSAASGFNIECPEASVIDCMEHNSDNEGYRIRNETLQSGLLRVFGNYGKDCTENGFHIGSPNEASAVPYSEALVNNNRYDNAGQNGIWLPQKLAASVTYGTNRASNSGSSETVLESDNLVLITRTDDAPRTVTTASSIDWEEGDNIITLNGAGTVSTINNLPEGRAVLLRKASNLDSVSVDELGNCLIPSGSSYTFTNSSTLVMAVRIGSFVYVNPIS